LTPLANQLPANDLAIEVGIASLVRTEASSVRAGLTAKPQRRRTDPRKQQKTLFLVMSLVFDELCYRRFEWKCDALNAPSRRAAGRFGFLYEGTFRQAVVVKGLNRDTAWFSIIESEWPRLKGAYEAWLSPDSFDEHGKQRIALSQLTAEDRTCSA